MANGEPGYAMEAASENLDTEVLDHGLSYLMNLKLRFPSRPSPPSLGGGLDFPGALGIETETRPHPRKDGRDGQDGNLSLGSH